MGKQAVKPTWESAARVQPNDSKTLEKIIQQAARGNKAALKSLCESIVRSVTFRVNRKLSSQSDAEDVTQEVLIRVCENIHCLKDPKAFPGWLNTIINNETNRFLRKNMKHGVVMSMDEYLDSIIFEEDESDYLALDYMLSDDERKEVIAIIDTLPERQLEAILLHYYEGMSITETAHVMGITKQVVAIHLARAKMKIKDALLKKQSKTGVVYGFSSLPVGVLLAQVLGEEASLMPVISGPMVSKALEASFYGKLTLAKTSGRVAKSNVLIFLLATTVTTTLFVSALLINGASQVTEATPLAAALPVVTEGEILFIGGEENRETVNPTSVEVWAENERGLLKVQRWWITPLYGEAVLSSGVGTQVDATLQNMYACEQEGNFMLWFAVEDNEGSTYKLQREFTIELPGAEQPKEEILNE